MYIYFFYGNVLYRVRRTKLAWLLLVQLLAFLTIQDGDLGDFEFRLISTFDLNNIEGRVIPLLNGFAGWGVYFCSYFSDTGSKSRSNHRSKVKFS